MKHTLKSVRSLAATLITFGSLAGGANAAITVFYEQVGGDVVFTYSGSFSINGFAPGSFTQNIIDANDFGDRFRNFNGDYSRIRQGGTIMQISGGTSGFFTSNFPLLTASSASGDTFAIDLGDGYVYAPSGYLAGQIISGSATFSGQTIAGLGLVDSSFDIGTGDVVNFSAVPEPSAALLIGLGVIGLSLSRRRKP